MFLEKWYADCTTVAGGLVVVYVATLRWGPLRLRYAATLEQDAPGAPLRQRQTLRPGWVRADASGVEFRVPALGVTGTWWGGPATAPEEVAATASGRVTWQALALGAHVDLAVEGRRHRGTGYAEVVELTLPPWRLPFRRLVWGRFVADDARAAGTWIGLDGDAATTWVWSDADPTRRAATVAERAVTTDADSLGWEAGETIRRDDVASTLLGGAAGPLRRLLPRPVRNLAEHKELSRGRLLRDGVGHDGWVLHETVVWS